MFFIPHGVVAQHGIEDGNHLSHTGSERDLFVFAIGEKSLVTISDEGVMLNGSQHGHEQHGSYRGSAAAYPPFASESAAVAIEGGDTDQCGDLFIGQHAEFRQIGEQGIDDLGADTGHGEQDIAFVPPLIDLFDQSRNLAIELVDLGLDVANVTTDVAGQEAGHDVEAIFLHGTHLDELASTSGHILDLVDISERYGTHLQAHYGVSVSRITSFPAFAEYS